MTQSGTRGRGRHQQSVGKIMTNAGVSPQQQHRSFSIISQMPGWVTLLTPPPGPAWCGGWAQWEASCSAQDLWTTECWVWCRGGLPAPRPDIGCYPTCGTIRRRRWWGGGLCWHGHGDWQLWPALHWGTRSRCEDCLLVIYFIYRRLLVESVANTTLNHIYCVF